MRRKSFTRFMFVVVGALAFVASSQRAQAMIDCEDPEFAEEEYCMGENAPTTYCCEASGGQRCCGFRGCTALGHMCQAT
jgi:hypothetical protein